MQDEVSAVRILFELLGFLLRQLSAISLQLSATSNQNRLLPALLFPPDTTRYFFAGLTGLPGSVYNKGEHFEEIIKRRRSMQRKASAVWKGGLKDGKGSLSARGGVLSSTQH